MKHISGVIPNLSLTIFSKKTFEWMCIIYKEFYAYIYVLGMAPV